MNRLENFQQKYDKGGIKTMDKKKKIMSNLLPENFRAYSSPNYPHLTKSKIIHINFLFRFDITDEIYLNFFFKNFLFLSNITRNIN